MVFFRVTAEVAKGRPSGKSCSLAGTAVNQRQWSTGSKAAEKKYRSSPSPPKLQFPAGGSKSGQASYVGTLAMQNIGVSLPGAERRAKKGSGRQMQKN